MGPGGPGRRPHFCPEISFLCKRVLDGTSSFVTYYILSLINIVNKKRICVRSLHF